MGFLTQEGETVRRESKARMKTNLQETGKNFSGKNTLQQNSRNRWKGLEKNGSKKGGDSKKTRNL